MPSSQRQRELAPGAGADDLEFGAALEGEWFERDEHELARGLLGRLLVRRTEESVLAGRIVETEVYGGDDDPASHADSGVSSQRTAAMFGDPGDLYVYQIYGQYYCLNVVAPAGDKPAAVLVRALEPLAGLETMARHRGLREDYDEQMPRSVRRNLLSGPGKICQALRIDDSLDATPLPDERLWIASGTPVRESNPDAIERSPRIGLNPETVGEAVDWEWRYVVETSEFLSR